MAAAAGVLVVLAGCGSRAEDTGRDGRANGWAAIDEPGDVTTSESPAVRDPDPIVDSAAPGPGPRVEPAGPVTGGGDGSDGTTNAGSPPEPATDDPIRNNTNGADRIPHPGSGVAPEQVATAGDPLVADGPSEGPRASTSTTAPAVPDTALDAEVAELEAEVEAFGGEATAVEQQLP